MTSLLKNGHINVRHAMNLFMPQQKKQSPKQDFIIQEIFVLEVGNIICSSSQVG